MKIEVQNNISDIKVSINHNSDGSVAVLLTETKTKDNMTCKKLGSVKPGETVIIGHHAYIVLSHGKDTTAVIAKNPVRNMVFGNDGDYAKSNIRAYCNNEFYEQLCREIGKDNIIPHTVNLVSDDGSNKGVSVKDNVSILTCDLYRRYREFLPPLKSEWWTATRFTTFDKDLSCTVVLVLGGNGFPCMNRTDYSAGVRPFCILNSSILVI